MSHVNSVSYSNTNSKSVHLNISYPNESSVNQNEDKERKNKKLKRGKMPRLFERASESWWNVRMDSRLLEEQYKISSIPQVRSMFQNSLIFVCIFCVSWIIYYSVNQEPKSWLGRVIWCAVLLVLSFIFLIITTCKIYQSYSACVNVIFLCLVIVPGLVSAYYTDDDVTHIGNIFLAAEIILLIYLVSPFPIPFTLITAVIFAIIFEILVLQTRPVEGKVIAAHILLYVSLQLLGCQVSFNLLILRHSTFWKICQVVQKTQEKDKAEDMKAYMIKTVMPVSVAEKLWSNHEQLTKRDPNEYVPFRPFTMERMENVSILYADIVGFTKMSANKNAAELVGLLNDLFGRFDKLCEETGCEKISTLGDCYYCVAGCPVARPDHAKCCVEMGLGMIKAIKQFCIVNKISVNMRVGIHTGYILCGIVGTKRFKFDVWSNDVTLANGMEQHGIPGRIHISKATLDCLNHEYIVEDSKLEERDKPFMERAGKTYLIVGAQNPSHQDDQDNNGRNDANNTSLTNQENGNRLPTPSVVTNDGSTEHKWLKKLSSRRQEQRNSNKRGSQESLTVTRQKQDQLVVYIGQHITPFSKPGALTRVREDEDKKFLNSIKNDPLMVTFYNRVSSFRMLFDEKDSPEVEGKYRGLCEEQTRGKEPIQFCISTRFRLFWDLVISCVFTCFTFVISMLLTAHLNDNTSGIASGIVVFVLAMLTMLVLTTLAGLYVYHTMDLNDTIQSIAEFLSKWTTRHVLCGFLLLLPAAVVFSHLSCGKIPMCSDYYLLLVCLIILHFLNYNQLMSWMRSFLSVLVAVAALLIIYVPPCTVAETSLNKTLCTFNETTTEGRKYEFIVNVLLLLLFVYYVNRRFEFGYRLAFYSDHEVKVTNMQMNKERAQVEELLENFIPPHVKEAMKDQPLYSKTHEKVGVIFGTIVNFNELYEEDYEGGMQFIRYLSELISDVDDLLKQEKFKDIEKIKNIGTTFMLASGLKPNTDQETTGSDSHLCKLVDFCIAMQDAVDTFNTSMVNFHLVLRIGFNHGEVTAGVIGTTKRLYDIWGDTVNIASRMDSTGVPGRIQVSEESKKALEEHYNFSFCGEKNVKGKGVMKTYLLVRDDEDSRVIKPNPTSDYSLF